MNWHEHIDIYCERSDISFWAEPINAITNLAFIIASIFVLRDSINENIKSSPILFLTFLLFFIGIGSFLFHTFANRWSEFADTIPIWLFVFFYIMYSARIVFLSSWFKTVRIMIIVFALSYYGFTLSQTDGSSDEMILNASLQYAPALFFMIIYSVVLYLKKANLYKYGFYAVAVFIVSLSFRTADMEVCSWLNIGTHFIWHILNAYMLYLLLYILIKAQKTNQELGLS